MGNQEDALKKLQAATQKLYERLDRVDVSVQSDLEKKVAQMKVKMAKKRARLTESSTAAKKQSTPSPAEDVETLLIKTRQETLPKEVIFALGYIGIPLSYSIKTVSQDIEQKRRELIKKIHPDKFPDPKVKEKVTELMHKVEVQLQVLEKNGLYNRN